MAPKWLGLLKNNCTSGKHDKDNINYRQHQKYIFIYIWILLHLNKEREHLKEQTLKS